MNKLLSLEWKHSSLTSIIRMAIFTIHSAVMSARSIIEEYAGKRAILLFSYPVPLQKLLGAKVRMALLYTVTAMYVCGLAACSRGCRSCGRMEQPKKEGRKNGGIAMGSALLWASVRLLQYGDGGMFP